MKMKKTIRKRVASVREMREAPMKLCDIGGGRAVIICRVKKDFYALDALCTHEKFPLIDGELAGRAITCPLHGARFDVVTGGVRALPAAEPLRTYPVEVKGGEIFVCLGGDKKRR